VAVECEDEFVRDLVRNGTAPAAPSQRGAPQSDGDRVLHVTAAPGRVRLQTIV